MSDHHERFPVWLRAELHRHGLNQTEFARAVGTSTSVVSRWVNAQAIPESESVDKIADVLNADLTTVMRLAGHLPAADPIDPDDPVERICGLPRRHVVVAKIEPAVRACLESDLAAVAALDEAVAAAAAVAGGEAVARARRMLEERRRAAEHRHRRARERWLAGREPLAWMDDEDARLAAELGAIAAELATLPAAPDPDRFAAIAVEIAAARALLAAASDRAMRRVLEAVGVAVVAEAGVSIAYRPEVARFVPRPITVSL
jgi:transcriptional regulator with XRE-family HTH domain